MLVVNVDKINLFRKIVAFDAFRKCYSNIFNIKHNENYDCLTAKTKLDQKDCAIFLFETPSVKVLENYKGYLIYVFYIRIPKKEVRGIIKKRLSKECIRKIVKIAESNFTEIDENSILLRKFSNINDIQNNHILYKYYSNYIKTDGILSQILNKGMISFSNPQTFNDPFDCDLIDGVKGIDKNIFKVLCLTPNYSNILMWSYYGNNHKGYCLGYNKDLILNELAKNYTGICFIGKVSYKHKRPLYRITKSLGKMDEILFYINCLFTKYVEWSHEEEYRMVIIDSDENKNKDYFTIYTTIQKVYVGCESTIALGSTKYIKLNKDVSDYLLY